MTVLLKTITRFWSKVNQVDEGCWEWMAGYFDTGYGAFYYKGQNRGAHRVAYAFHHGVPLDSLETICHACDNPKCVRPDHLFSGNHGDNMRDMFAKGREVNIYAERTECSGGHPYVVASTPGRTSQTVSTQLSWTSARGSCIVRRAYRRLAKS